MNRASRGTALMLVLALFLSWPAAARAQSATDFWNHAGIPDLSELKELGVGELANIRKDPIWSADAGILGVPGAKFFLYPVAGSSTPALAVVLPVDLTVSSLTKYLFDDDGYLDLGLRKPILFWVPKGVANLDRNAMPAEAQSRAAEAGLPAVVRVQQGVNLYGRVGGGFLGYLTRINFPNPDNLTVSLASRKEKKDNRALKFVTTSVGLSADAAWRQPFGLADTALRGATLRMTTVTDQATKSRQKLRETWGTARIRDKDYTAYLQRDELGLDETLAFDVRQASLVQFFDVLHVVSATLGIPSIPAPPLALDLVELGNTNYVAPTDAASPPVFDKMMFMGRKDARTPLNSRLIVHGQAKVFGWSAAHGDINASSNGIQGDVALDAARIGPIETPSASFYLKVNQSQQDMGVKAKTSIYGDLDLKAGARGLSLVVSPACPLRPLGFRAELSSLSLTDFPITPLVASEDCFRKSLEALVSGAEDAYRETRGFVEEESKEAVDAAQGLYHAASAEVDKYVVQRAETWVKEIGAAKATKDVERAARDAYNAASQAVTFIGNQIDALGSDIRKLTREIEDLLGQAWSLITTGKLKDKKKERKQKIAKQDDYRAQQPAAVRRRDDARKVLDKTTAEAANFPSPYLSAAFASTHEPLLGALTQASVQKSLEQRARALPTELADAQKRKALFARLDTKEASLASRVAALSDGNQQRFRAFRNMSELANAGGSGEAIVLNAKKALLSEAISAKADADTEELLAETVVELPTLDFTKAYFVVLDQPGAATPMCLVAPRGHQPLPVGLAPCRAQSDMRLAFHSSGWVRVPDSDGMLDVENNAIVAVPREVQVKSPIGTITRRYSFDAGTIALFYFDAFEGVIRYLATNASTPLCVRSQDNRVFGGPCPGPHDNAPGARWHLATEVPGTGVLKAKALRSDLPSLGQAARTNVAPYKLLPRPAR